MPTLTPGDLYVRQRELAVVTPARDLCILSIEGEDHVTWSPGWVNVSNDAVFEDVRFRDMVGLWHGRWMTSSAMHRVLQAEFRPKPGFAMMDPIFYDSVVGSRNSWAWKSGLDTIERGETLLVPVHERKHWSAVIVDVKNMTIYHIDSIRGYHSTKRIAEAFDSWASHSLNHKVKFDVEVLHKGQQDNETDCGIWTICFLVKFAINGKDFEPYSNEFVRKKRRFFVYKYLYEPAVERWELLTGRDPDTNEKVADGLLSASTPSLLIGQGTMRDGRYYPPTASSGTTTSVALPLRSARS